MEALASLSMWARKRPGIRRSRENVRESIRLLPAFEDGDLARPARVSRPEAGMSAFGQKRTLSSSDFARFVAM